jgi:hypothetical protein
MDESVSECSGGKPGFCFDWDLGHYFCRLQRPWQKERKVGKEEMCGSCGSLKAGLFGPLRGSSDSVLCNQIQ